MSQEKTVLCIDDDDDVLEALETMLEAEGYRPVLARSGREGLVRLEEKAPDFILVDLMMESLDAGLAFVEKAKARPQPPPVYMLSSVGDQLAAQVTAGEKGLDGILQKPLDRGSLLALLRRHLG